MSVTLETCPPAGLEEMISHTPGVCGGEACIRQTRIAVWMLVAKRRAGMCDAELRECHPDLDERDLEAAWSYYTHNSAEIDAAIAEDDLI